MKCGRQVKRALQKGEDKEGKKKYENLKRKKKTRTYRKG